MQDQSKEARPEPSKADLAKIIKMFWEALLTPQWYRNDLIDLGKLVFAKVPLGKIDPALIARLLPPLTEVAREIHRQLIQPPRDESPRPETEKPTETA
jgi:hypothetical protein